MVAAGGGGVGGHMGDSAKKIIPGGGLNGDEGSNYFDNGETAKGATQEKGGEGYKDGNSGDANG
jgi:hypothetical protein